jgi:hypothetical protein
MTATNANSIAWAKAVDKYQILERVQKDGFADVSATELKVFREPRHMGKIDHEENLPEVFSENNLTILTLSNSSYRVGQFEIFQKLPAWEVPGDEVETISFPIDLETLDIDNLTSEPSVLNAAYSSQMLQNFCEEDLILTVSGRMRTGIFDFDVDVKSGGKQSLKVSNAQMEIDAGYEGKKNFYIFEAKNHSAKNFNLRQIYYPTRSWSQKIKKPVVPIFLTHSNDVFDLYQFAFENARVLSSAHLASHRRFMLAHKSPETKDLFEIAKKVKESSPAPSPEQNATPFPQADNFEKVVDLVGILLEEPRSADDITTHFAFDPRQSDYYFNAAKYLGLASSSKDEEGILELRRATPEAERIFKLPYKEKYTAIAGKVLEILPLAEAYDIFVREKRKPTIQEIASSMKNYPPTSNLADSTLKRRAQTLSSWMDWLKDISHDA